MNRISGLVTTFGLAILMLSSCWKTGAPLLNSEADILTATIPDATDLLQTEPIVRNTEIEFRLKSYPSNFDFSPEFTITDGATIQPVSGTELDFSKPQSYTVTSQDGKWNKTYSVKFIAGESSFHFSFENVKEDSQGHYDIFLDDDDPERQDWDSGNPGYRVALALLGGELKPENYPTFSDPDGFKGKGVKLVTRETGTFGVQQQAPIAAGNLFIGNFAGITLPPTKGTHFGQPYNSNHAPVSLTGYFKYKAGSVFQNNSGDADSDKDKWNALAVLFEKSDQNNYLDGATFRTDPRVVAWAELTDAQRIETDEWTQFEIPFEFRNGKTFDPGTAYMYTIVISSSKDGDKFNGALGSALSIDEVELVTEK